MRRHRLNSRKGYIGNDGKLRSPKKLKYHVEGNRKANPEARHRNVPRHRLNSGKGCIGNDGKLRSPKKLKILCGSKCRYQCKQHFSEIDRESICHMFWRLNMVFLNSSL